MEVNTNTESNGNEKDAIDKILDKRIVDDRETWYLVKWCDEKRENTWVEASELPSQSHGLLIAQFEEELAGKDPDEEFTVESITDKRELEGVIYYKCKWLGFPDSDSTWEPSENIFAKNLIAKYEATLNKSQSLRKKKGARQDEDFTPDEDIVAGPTKRPRRPARTRNVPQITPPLEPVSQSLRKSGRTGSLSSSVRVLEDGADSESDIMYSHISARVPPCSYDSSDFEQSHKFFVRMSNYLSWLVIEHHICVYEQFKVLTRQERKTALEKRLRQFSMSDVIVEIILARESGIWDAVTCMNLDKRKMETIRMRRFIRDNETIPLPLDWPIMKFVAHIDINRNRSCLRANAKATIPTVKSKTKAKPGRKRKRNSKSKRKNKSDTDEDTDPLEALEIEPWNVEMPEGESNELQDLLNTSNKIVVENPPLDNFESSSCDTILEKISNEINQASTENKNRADELNQVQAQNTLSASGLVLTDE